MAQIFAMEKDLKIYSFFMIGCMAERLKTQLLETDKMVDLVAGPGRYMYIAIPSSINDHV